MKNKKIFWDLPDIGFEEEEMVIKSIKSGYVGARGKIVKKFEEEIKKKFNVKHAVTVNNGTSALLVSLFALKEYLGKEIKIAVPSFTFIASVNTSLIVGKEVKLIDCNCDTWNIDLNKIPKNIDVIMSVDVGGLPCDYDRLRELKVPILADSAESAGARYKGILVGSQCEIHCFSLHRAKIITAGEGGFITTNSTDLYNLIISWINHGYDPNRKEWEYKHRYIGLNCRMTDLEAAIGLIQLKKLERYVEERRRKARIYKEIIGDLVEYQRAPEYAFHPYFFFGILLKNYSQEKFCKKMYESGIVVKTWTAVHLQPYIQKLKKCRFKCLPMSEEISRRIVLLPIHNKLSLKDVEHIAEKVRKILLRRG